ncbi:MAG TPA: amino acid permease, partial [Tistrella mobilis]|nr:amino acid permease [Tistrella mobilis]
ASAEMKNPARDVPLTIAVSGILIAAFYLFATIGILIALPLEEIDLVSGIVDTLRVLLGEGGASGAFVIALGLMALYSFLANMVTWTMGANRSAAEAAIDGNLPPMFARLHAVHKTPASAAIVTGVVTTVVIVIYGFLAADAEDLFWTLFAFSSIVFLLPYLLMFAAFLRLRSIDASTARPYRVPGGEGGAWVLALLCILFILQAIVFFIYTPGEFDATYAASVVIGVLVTILIGEFLVRGRRRA